MTPFWHSIKDNISRQIAEKWPHAIIFSVCVMCMGVMRWDSLTEQVEAHETRLSAIEVRQNADHDLLTGTSRDVLDIKQFWGIPRYKR